MISRDDITQVPASAAAERLGVSPAALKAWRAAGRGPAFRRRYGRVFYDAADLDAFIEAQQKIVPADPVAASAHEASGARASAGDRE